MLRHITSFILTITVSWMGLTGPAVAAIVETQQALSMETRQEHIDWAQAQLARSDIRQGLIEFGVDPDHASARVASLTDQELLQLRDQLESVPAGGSVLGLVGAVFVVLLILELTGVIDIFKQ